MDPTELVMHFTAAAPISAALFRMVGAGFLLLFTLILRNHYELPFKNGLVAVAIILLVRDFVAIFVHNFGPLFYVTDAIVLVLYAILLMDYKVKDVLVWQFSIITLASLVIIMILQFIFPGVFFIYLALALHSMASTIWFGILMFSISIYNASNAQFMIINRTTFFTLLLVSRFFTMWDMNFEGIFTLFFSLPFGYIPYIFMVIQFYFHFHAQSLERDEFIRQYIESLFDFMRTIGTAMTSRIEVKNILRYVVQTMMRFTSADAGLVMLRDPEDSTLRVEYMDGYYPPPFAIPPIVKTKLQGVQRLFESTHIKPGETVLGQVAQQNQSMYVRKVSDEPSMEANAKDDTLFISSFIGVPLIVNREVFGVASIIRRKKDNFFSQLDYERAKVFGEYASLTLDSLYNYSQLLEKQEIEREVNIAATIQQKLLPGRMPKTMKNLVAAYTKSAKGVSGDYYDIIPLNRAGKFSMVICDVAGKGVPASLIMVMIRTIVHLIAGATKEAGKVVTWINRGIAGSIDIERFATLSYMVYDPLTSVVEYSNAGHHPAVHYCAETKEIKRIDSPGLPVGLERETVYGNLRIKIAKGDVIMLYTDGIIESLSPKGEQYEEERLQSVFLRNVQNGPKAIVDAIIDDIGNFVGNAKQHDDMTLIIFKA